MDYRVIILADRGGAELAPLDRQACPALLEVAGKAVIEYTIEDLVEAGIRAAVVVTHSLDAMRRRLRDGARWGIGLRYLLVRPDSAIEDSLARLTNGGPRLVVRGDVLRGRCVGRFLEAAGDSNVTLATGVSAGRPVGLWFDRAVHVPGFGDKGVLTGDIDLGAVGFHPLDSLKDFHSACLAAARGDLPGHRFDGRETGPGVVAGRLARVGQANVEEGALYVAERAKIGRDVVARGTVVVGSGALVDRNATLEDTVVMPDSYVGGDVELRQAIVAGSRLIRVDLGTTAEVADDFLLASLARPAWRPARVSLVDRLAGLLMLLVTAPLWPVALLASLITDPRRPIRRRRCVGNRSAGGRRREFTAWSWAAGAPMLRHLPSVLAVVAGHLRVVGVRPRSAGGVEGDALDSPAGLFGPALLDVEPDADEQGRRLAEIVFESRNSRRTRLAYLARGVAFVFDRRAWLGAAEARRRTQDADAVELPVGGEA